MLALDKETFSYWVTTPDDLTPTDFVQLQESLEVYPYCQALYTLTAKAASAHQKNQTVSYVRQAAAHALSRNALRKLIENEFQWSENLLTRLNELSAKHVPIPEDYQQESYALFKAKTGIGNGFPKLSLLRLPGQNVPEQTVTVPTPEDPTLAETNLQNDLAQIAEVAPDQSVLSPVDLERQRQLDLIDSFIKKEPRISPVRTKLGEPLDQEDLTKRNKVAGGGLVTESFAKILEKQGKIDKAREIYEQLIVKNPEKKAYFAAKIGELTSTADQSAKS
jgi:tetratricopeptide (TPR) repeat protein